MGKKHYSNAGEFLDFAIDKNFMCMVQRDMCATLNFCAVVQEKKRIAEHPPELVPSQLRMLLETMYRIRAFEEKVDELFMHGEVHGTTHLSVGEEATATGALLALQTDD
ncbi:MAG: hypothetical protein PVSMB2_22560 [Ktedonobacteraceae bacterium]